MDTEPTWNLWTKKQWFLGNLGEIGPGIAINQDEI